jgi:hypothetical protein
MIMLCVHICITVVDYVEMKAVTSQVLHVAFENETMVRIL